MATSTRLHQLAGHGQSVWIDFLSRELLRSGELARLMREDAVTGVTSNPTIFAKALSGGNAYDEQIAASDGRAFIRASVGHTPASHCRPAETQGSL